LQKELTTFKNKQLTRAEKQLDELSKLNKLEKEALEVAKQSHTFAMTDIAPLNKIVDDAVTKNDDTVSGSVIVKHIATLKIKRLEIAKLIKHHEQQNELTKNDSSASELRETNNNIIQKLTEYNKNCEIAIDRYTRYLNEIQSRGDKKQKTTKAEIDNKYTEQISQELTKNQRELEEAKKVYEQQCKELKEQIANNEVIKQQTRELK
jgi:hypothetical protein